MTLFLVRIELKSNPTNHAIFVVGWINIRVTVPLRTPYSVLGCTFSSYHLVSARVTPLSSVVHTQVCISKQNLGVKGPSLLSNFSDETLRYRHPTCHKTKFLERFFFTRNMASITASRVPASGLSAQGDTASTHPYTCNTCQVAFRNSELQRGHMRSDWQ